VTSDCRIALFDGVLRLAWFNRAAAEQWDLTSADLGRSAVALSDGRAWPWLAGLQQAGISGEPERLWTEGRLIRFELATRPDDGVLVTDLDPASFALGDAASVESMWRRVGKMASVIAHEVKNPLAGVSGALHVIANRFARGSPEREIVAEMQARLGSLNATIDELLLFARPVHVRSRVAPIRVVLDRAVEALRKHPDGGRVEVEVRGDAPEVRLDVELVSHAMTNVLVNAAQASPTGGRVEVTVRADGERIRVAIADDGPGVAAEVAPLVFQPFFTRKSRGAGLGLTVARRIIEAHAGRIELSAPPARGAEFAIDLPAAPA